MKEGFEKPIPARVERESGKEADAKPEHMSRRSFMRGLLNTAIASALASSAASKLAEAAPGYERIPPMPGDAAFLKKLLADPEALKRFREAPTPEGAAAIVRALARSDISWLETLRTSDAMHTGSVPLTDRHTRFVGNGTRIRVHDGIGADGYPVYRYFLLTARHVAEHVPAQEKEWAFHPGGYDVAVSEMDPHTIPWSTVNPKELDAFDFDMAMRPERELDGMAGIVLATNKRYRAGEERSAHASRISPVFDVKFLAALGITPESKRRQDRFRMIVLPPGYGAEGPDGQTPTNGDSGAPFLGEKRGSLNVEIDGILAGSVEKVIDGVKYSLAQILDRELIRETIQHAIGPSSGPSRFAEPKLKR